MEQKWKLLRRIVLSLCLAGVVSSGIGCNDSSSKPDNSRSRTSTPPVSSSAATPQQTDLTEESKTSSIAADVDSSGQPTGTPPPEKPDSPENPNSLENPTGANPNVAPLGRPAPVLNTSGVPKVLLTDQHAALCAVKTRDRMPDMQLPNLAGDPTSLSSLYGERLTVVCFWKGDRALARAQLADLGPDVAAEYSDQGVKVVAVAVEETSQSASKQASDSSVTFPMLVDADGKAFELVGSEKLPRTYLLDAEGNILWFDIEYSRSTRRELQTAIRSIVGAG